MKRLFFVLFVLFSAAGFLRAEKLSVVATTTDLADLTRAVGGERVSVVSLASGDQVGCHSVEPRPSMVVNLRKADALVRIGMDYDSWADSLVDASRNANIAHGAPGYIDTSVGIARLEVPRGRVDPSMGHVHLYGNPHYWLDPENAKVITENIMQGLSGISPEDGAYFRKNREAFLAKLDGKMEEWSAKLKGYRGSEIVSYHKTWEYFALRFGFEIIATVEPKPGIPPSPAYLNTLVKTLENKKDIMIFHENCYPVRTSKMVAAETGARLLVLPVSSRGMGGAVKDYFDLFDYIVAGIAGAPGEGE